MHRRVLAFDFDGTLAENGRVPPALQTALERRRAADYALFLVTGRRFQGVALGSLADISVADHYRSSEFLGRNISRRIGRQTTGFFNRGCDSGFA